MYWGSMYRVKRLALILLAFALVASAAFAGSETKTYLIGLEEGTDSAIAAQYGAITYQFNAINVIAAQLTPEAAALLAQEPGVNFVEENKEQIMAGEDTPPEIPAKPVGIGVTSYTPGSQWNLAGQGINAESAWNKFGVTGTGVKIAIIGSGVNYTLPDLQDQYLGGYDFAYNDSDPMDTLNWGTNKASIILGKGTTVKGIASGAGYYAIKVFTDNGEASSLNKASGIDWAINHQADIVLLDWWDSGESYTIRDLIRAGYSKGILFVGRAGDAPDQRYPAGYDKSISVGGHKQDQTLLGTTQPHNVSVVAPGDNILVLQANGTAIPYSLTSVAAAHAVGALALMADFNRQRSLDYNNSSLWAVLNYSAVDWAGAAAGSGKADVNAALAWMDRNWFIDKNALYWNPNSSNNGAPVYYYGSAFDYDVNVANFSDEAFYNLAVTAKVVYLEGAKKGQLVAEIPVFQASVSQLNPGQSVAVGPVPVALAATIEPGLKGMRVEVGVGKQGVSPGVVMAFSVLLRGWVLAAASPEGIVHLYSIPSYKKEKPYYSGAAVAEMILDYIRASAGYSDLNQDQVYAYGMGLNGNDLNADGMDAVLGHFDPYDSNVRNYLDAYDSLRDGNPYQGYNYTVDTYDPNKSPGTINDYMRDIAHWMAYPVTKEAWWLHGALVAEPNTPAALPIFGDYNHWVALNGFAASENPCPYPQTNPWFVPDFTIYGFWLTDPAIGGIGEHAYVTADDANSMYFKPLQTSDKYNGKYLQIAEPPAIPPEETLGEIETETSAKAKIAEPAADTANLEFIGIETTAITQQAAPGIAATENQPAPAAKMKKQSWKDIVDPHLLSDENAAAAFEGTRMGKPVLVKRTDNNTTYYLVPFKKTVKIKAGKKTTALTGATGVIMLDAGDGHFKQAAWAQQPQEYLPITKEKAIQLAEKTIKKENNKAKVGKAAAELAWRPNAYSQTPFKPWWAVTANCGAWVVTQEGKVYKA